MQTYPFFHVRTALTRCLLLCLIVFALPHTLFAQEGTPEAAPAPLVVASNGLLDTDGTALYSVLVASGQEDLADLTITALMPEGAAFVEAIWTPQSAEFTGESEGIVTWTLSELSADTIVGPFTFRAAFLDEDAEMPLNVAVSASTGDLTATAPLVDHLPFPYTTELMPFAESGSIMVDAEGTEVPQPVGETNIWIYVPEGAVSQSTTLTFTRLPIEGMNLPQDLYWWCTLVRVEIDPAVSFEQPITLALPTRRTLTPGMEAFVSVQEGTEWLPVETQARIHGNGMFVVMEDLALLSGESDLLLAAGVDTSARQVATAARGAMSSQYVEKIAFNNPGYIDKIIFNNPGIMDPDIDFNQPGQ